MTLFYGLYFEQYYIHTDVKFLHKLHSIVKIVLSKFMLDNFHNLETIRFSASLKFRQFLSVFFIITYDLIGKLKFWCFYQKDLVQIYQNKPFFSCNSIFLNSDDCIGEISSIFIKTIPKTIIFRSINMNFNMKRLDLC